MEKQSSINNQIQEQQEPCACNRGLKVRFYCTRNNCEEHKDNIFFCDECFEEIMNQIVAHPCSQIHKLRDSLIPKWMALIEKENQLYSQFSAMYNKEKLVIEYLEQHMPPQFSFSGTLFGRSKQ